MRFTRISGNKKTGPMPVTTSDRSTCPKSCAFYGNGCYAEAGPLRMVWNKTSNETTGASLVQIRKLPKGTMWRHNQAGDLPGDNETIDAQGLDALVRANKGKNGFTYTHKPMTAENRNLVRDANARGFIVNLSANNLRHADELASLNIAPVVVVLPSDAPRVQKTAQGHTVIQCPATYEGSKMQCIDCGLCAKPRKAIIGFPAHGVSVKKANLVAIGGRNV